MIEGKGVFSLEDITKNSIVWKFDPSHDESMSTAELDRLDEDAKTALLRVAYFSLKTNRYVYPPEDDPARFTNHSESNNLSVVFDESESEEPFFVANRDIKEGEELTVNYTEFDARPSKVLEWK